MPPKKQDIKREGAVMGRMLPHNLEAEQSVFGCVLIDDEISYYVLDNLKSEDFYSEAHAVIYNGVSAIKNQGVKERVDFVTLVNALEQAGTLAAAGGAQYITTLSSF
ncbi:MAG: hypothetical protein LBS99_01555, partial [Clostridiales bacterium]|nr:hypothetical protein [Clostridiales bacterium]